MMNNEQESISNFFGIVDYVLFVAILIVSVFVGLYVAFFGKRERNTTNEYLLGSRKMAIFPTAMSLTASHINALLVIGLPAEIYTYGTPASLYSVTKVLACCVFIYVGLPVFYDLQFTSVFQYLKLRYNNSTRMVISFFWILRQLLALPISVYVPSIAFSQATGLSLNIVIPLMSLVCTFYTAIGGLKGVIWTDTLQMIMIVLGVFVVSILGTINVGGFKQLWDINVQGERIEFFNFSFDVTERQTFWNTLFGSFIGYYSSLSIDQAMVQRCLSLPSRSKANICVLTYALVTFVIYLATCYNGLLLYAAFHDCDPSTLQTVNKSDQLLSYYVLRLMKSAPGIPGIFISAIVCAALTSLSTYLNSTVGVILVDFIQPLYKKPISERAQSCLMKTMVVLLGLYSIFGAFFVSTLGNLLQTVNSLGSIVKSPTLGVFLLGILFPWANSTGAMVGVITGTLLCGWISLGTQVAISNKQIIYPRKPVSIAGCSNETLNRYYDLVNQTISVPSSDPGKVFPLYMVSFRWYPLIGVIVTLLVGIPVSFLTGPNKPRLMDPALFSPIIRKYLHTEQEMVEQNKLVQSPEKSNTKESERKIEGETEKMLDEN